MPRLHVDDNPHLVSPGVKWGVQPDSFTHCTELFGPVLGVMEARDLDEAIDLVNATGYGLTSGLESLDDREQELWRERIRAGNLYINRPTTGAIVLRQPFGGMGKSSVGPGIKAGGPNYVVPLMRFHDAADRHPRRPPRRPLGGLAPRTSTVPNCWPTSTPPSANTSPTTTTSPIAAEDLERVVASIDSYLHWATDEFHVAHDHFRLLGEDNFRRYLPVEPLRIRVHARRHAVRHLRPRRRRPRRRLPRDGQRPARSRPVRAGRR